MASNHTSNYNLNQWEPEDKVIRTEFNEDNQKIDGALNGLATQISTKADQSGLDTLAATVAKKANQSALDAVAATIPKIAVGTYTGTGGQKRTIQIGFTPKAVFVNSFFGGVYDYYEGRNYCGGLAVTGGPVKWDNTVYEDTVLEVVSGGFRVSNTSQYGNNSKTNASGVVYHYLAIG